jgi:hypothetical protein
LARRNRSSLPLFIALTAGPALIVGAGLWYFAGTLPSCEIVLAERLTSPDARFDLVTFSRACGASVGPNTQAALVPAGDAVPEDATSFLSIGANADLGPRWDGFGNIELSVPPNVEIYRNDDTVAGISVIYR